MELKSTILGLFVALSFFSDNLCEQNKKKEYKNNGQLIALALITTGTICALLSTKSNISSNIEYFPSGIIKEITIKPTPKNIYTIVSILMISCGVACLIKSSREIDK